MQITEDKIRIETRLAVPLDQAWSLLTQHEHISSWWGDHVTLEARVGGMLMEAWWNAGRHVVTSGEVLLCDAPSLLEMTWADDDWPGPTRVAFHLSDRHGDTRLVLEHSGWLIHPDETRRSLVSAHAEGWSHHMRGLVEYATELGPKGSRP